MRSLVALLVLFSLLALGCERPFVEAEGPTLSLKAPNLDLVQTRPDLRLVVEATSFRRVSQVTANEVALAYDPSRRSWEGTVTLTPGTNRLILAATDAAGLTTVDTVFAAFVPFGFLQAPARLPEGRGGHTATLLPDGTVLVAGGAATIHTPALGDALLLQADERSFERLAAALVAARTGHTATLLPDGRVLLLGGARTERLTRLDELVDVVEAYDPAARTFTRLTYDGPPLRRAFHTATLVAAGAAPVVALFGGRGDVAYGAGPRLGTRQDVQRFRVEGDRLVLLDPAPGGSLGLKAVAGHVQVPLSAALSPTLVSGTYFAGATPDPVSAVVTAGPDASLRAQPTAPPLIARTRHAAAPLRSGYAALLGGLNEARQETYSEAELYAVPAERYFLFPTELAPAKRYGHTATKLPSQRILLVGGFSPLGTGITGSEYFLTDF